MKILKIFGVVVAIHVFALILIFANPGCSSSTKPAPTPADTAAKTEPPAAGAEVSPITAATGEAAGAAFDPNAPATAAVRFSPTRPGTPAASSLEAQPVADVTPASTYTVNKGDSLWTIAKKHHMTVAELAAANNLKAGATVRIGQKLIIPAGPAAGSAAAAAPAPNAAPTPAGATPPTAAKTVAGEPVRHVVKPGETLGAIARKYGVKVGDIATANNISDPAKIRPGVELTIPNGSGRAAKSGAPAKAAPAPVPSAEAVPTIMIPAEGEGAAAASGNPVEPPVIKVDDAAPAPAAKH